MDTDQHLKIEFRPLTEPDLELLYKWLHTDFVIEWYEKKELSMDEIRKKYFPYITGDRPTRAFVFLINGKEAGFIQTYLIRDYPKYASAINVDPDAAGIDLFIGEQEFIHQGYGKDIISSFLKEQVFSDPQAGSCVLGPEPDNKTAIRAYEKAGFKFLKLVQVPGEEQPEYLMQIRRPVTSL